MTTGRFCLVPRGPYSLAASARFLEGFAPAAHQAAPEGHLHLAFPGPGGAPAGVCLRQEEDDGAVVGEVFGGADPSFVQGEAERILSLDHDGSAFAAVGERDRVVGGLQARFAGLRPVLFLSPYEAAAWALIGHQAAGVKGRMAGELGDAVDIHGDVRHAFPRPSASRAWRGSPASSGARWSGCARWARRRAPGLWTPPVCARCRPRRRWGSCASRWASAPSRPS